LIEIEFYDREKEIREIMGILNSRPDLITFVYGPINSGKTELFSHLIGKLSDDYVVFYINLRERMISNFNDFIEALFEIDVKGRRKMVIGELIAEITKFAGIPISKTLLDQFFKEDKPKNAFRYIVEVVKDVRAKGKIPVLILDELQKIGDVKIDDFLIYELFNLFIRLTKELHCCHVFAVTSDSLFIERVYSEAMLQGRCEYLLVDDFDYETTKGFLKKYGFSNDEIRLVWDHFGGKPIYLVRCVRAKKSGEDLESVISKFLKVRIGQIRDVMHELKEKDEKTFKGVVELLGMFEDRESIDIDFVNDAIRFCVRKNILFVDPVERIVKPQSKLDLLAIRKILRDLKGELNPNS